MRMLRSHEEFYGKAAMMKGKIAEGAICYTGDLFDPAREIFAELLCRHSERS
ncbi:hypothetical protein LL253_19510 [Sphingobium soli]|uniref:Uncharacterized protein n=1 Tax=Sphingobium soli TaxID=1591116 RepID=A0ABS8HA17_9SPHN|nr:hypothetical protein [Sphingobium soli]EAT07184.1 hypothetical protein SKA58_11860 [Sphingomonas sp. SKA58]MCC4234863.1 hypothetical protein [Sphingobium soli]|tara:strand:+ start:255 stop:410 length:156 start_codon:yes stop_codon:yes gene_type:complete